MPLWSGTRRLVIFSARFSRFVGEYRCPAFEPWGPAWPAGLKIGNVFFVGIRCREQICCKNRRPTRCCGNVRGFEPPLSLPVHAALLAALHGALHAASTPTGSTHVALGEDLIAPQEASLATSGDAAGRVLAFLDGTPSGSGFRVSDQPSAGRQRNQCRRCQKNDCQRED